MIATSNHLFKAVSIFASCISCHVATSEAMTTCCQDWGSVATRLLFKGGCCTGTETGWGTTEGRTNFGTETFVALLAGPKMCSQIPDSHGSLIADFGSNEYHALSKKLWKQSVSKTCKQSIFDPANSTCVLSRLRWFLEPEPAAWAFCSSTKPSKWSEPKISASKNSDPADFPWWKRSGPALWEEAIFLLWSHTGCVNLRPITCNQAKCRCRTAQFLQVTVCTFRCIEKRQNIMLQ